MHPPRVGLAAVLGALALVAGCTSPSPTPAPPATSATPVSTVGPTGEVPVDAGAKLSVDPIGSDGNGAVSATFSTPDAGRTVYLQTASGSSWNTLATAVEDASGTAAFSAPSGKYSYRAVAAASGSQAAAATATVAAKAQYHTLLADDFNGNSLNDKYWSIRMPGVYSKVRTCSASQPKMVSVTDGQAALSVNTSDAAQTAKAKAAAISLGAKASNPCPYGAYDNAMFSSEGKVTFTYGLVAARVKFPPEQGQHACAWLQAADGSGDEIDFAETFGLGKGIQYKLYHYVGGTLNGRGGYITSIPAVKTAQWWDSYHIVSVEWTKGAYRIAVDGQQVLHTTEHVASSGKFLIFSLLTSDWELNRLDPSTLPTSMDVDWVRIMQK